MTISTAERAGAASYTRSFLSVYDLYVLDFSNPVIWRCPTRNMLALYNENISSNHLDVGPGSGWYLREVTFPTGDPSVALFDLNPNSLDLTTERLQSRDITAARYEGSILQPLPMDQRFDSVATNFLMHCVPGTWTEKGVAFQHIAQVLTSDGVFFGSTILAHGVDNSFLARAAMAAYNNVVHSFHNTDDDLAGLEQALRRAFDDVTVTVHGSVALWVARRPRSTTNP